MKLLLDQNLSRKLVARLAASFPDSGHVAELGLDRASDRVVWDYAGQHGYLLVSKDSDMVELSLLHGAPPKVVWLRLGNVSTAAVEEALTNAAAAIAELVSDDRRTVLSIIEKNITEE